MPSPFPIGRVARRAACKVQTIRYYEQIGILPVADRTQGNQRIYGQDTVRRLVFIRHARELGFSLDAIRQLLSLSDDPTQPCETANEIAEGQLQDVEKRIDKLQSLKSELQRMVHQCKGGKISDCRVIEVLSNHSLCITDHQEAGTE